MTRDEVLEAAERIRGHVRRTPVLTIEAGALGISSDVICKLDLLQPTGSFKVRGATSLLLARDVPPEGVVAASGGNFGLAVAWAARRLDHRASVFVPATSPPEKIDPIRELGADVIVVDGFYAQALAAARQHAATTGAMEAHAYDQREVAAGHGTVTLELLDDAGAVDTLLVACGGGGLLAGAVAVAGPDLRIIAVETIGTPTLHAARAAGGPVDVEVGGIAASALGVRRIGELAWAAQPRVADAVLVADAAVVEAQRRLWHAARLAAEPAGVVPLAALISGAYRPAASERVAVLVCGGNVDLASVA